MDEENIIENLTEILKEGTEEEIRNFLVDNFDKFPEDLKTTIVGTFFEESLDRLEKFNKELSEVMEVFEMYDTLNYLKQKLEDRLKELKLRQELLGENSE
ncbi:MAG: hypothetical protein KatS3mg095_0299 [Candidatus Parcubacteria bacterium]|nr:MAG: hypothetical protein KatS3mg095_0299 [Candidatus Parcubacteria bacterium]